MKNPRLKTISNKLALAVNPRQLSVNTPERAAWRKWYGLKLWQQLRHQQLTRQPLCEMCLGHKRVEVATVVDHKTPHRGQWEKFIDPENFQSLCKKHHDSTKQKIEKRGGQVEIGGDESGMPLDPNHHWNCGP